MQHAHAFPERLQVWACSCAVQSLHTAGSAAAGRPRFWPSMTMVGSLVHLARWCMACTRQSSNAATEVAFIYKKKHGADSCADDTHARLCKYYKRMSFEVVREVGGNGLSDLPHQLVWGGVGTRMDADISAFLRRWSNAIRNRR